MSNRKTRLRKWARLGMASAGAMAVAIALPCVGFAYLVAPGSVGNTIHMEIYDPVGGLEDLRISAEVLEHPDWIQGITVVAHQNPLMEAVIGFDVPSEATVGANGKLSVRLDAVDWDGEVVLSDVRELGLTLASGVPETQRSYRIEECCVESGAGVDDATPVHPTDYVLLGNSPNPFNPLTTIRFGLPATGSVELKIYDVAGRNVRTIVTPALGAGYHQITWNGKNASGRFVPPGVYFYELKSDDWMATDKMLLLR